MIWLFFYLKQNKCFFVPYLATIFDIIWHSLCWHFYNAVVSFGDFSDDADSALFADLSQQDRLLASGVACSGATEAWWSSWWLCTAHQQSATSQTHTDHAPVTHTAILSAGWLHFLESPWKKCPFLQDLESRWKQKSFGIWWKRYLKVLEFEYFIIIITVMWKFCSQYLTPSNTSVEIYFSHRVAGLLSYYCC